MQDLLKKTPIVTVHRESVLLIGCFVSVAFFPLVDCQLAIQIKKVS